MRDKPNNSRNENKDKPSYRGKSDSDRPIYRGNSDRNQSDKPSFRGNSDRKETDRPSFRGDSDRNKSDKPSFRGNSDRNQSDRSNFRGDSDRNKSDRPSFRGVSDRKDSDRPSFRGDSDRNKLDRPSFRGNSDRKDSDRPSFRGDSDRNKSDRPSFRGNSDRNQSDRPSYRGDSDRNKSDRPSFRGDSDRNKSDRPSFRGDSDRNKSDRPSFRGDSDRNKSDRPSFRGDSDRNKSDRPSYRGESDRNKSDRPSFRGNSDRPNYSDRNKSDRPSYRGESDRFEMPRDRREFNPNDRQYSNLSEGTSFRSSDGKPSRERIKPERENPRKKTYEAKQVGEKRMPNFDEERLKKQLPPKVKQRVEASEKSDDSIRLNRYIANAGLCSRREADEFIASGQITVNGKEITEMGYKVLPSDVVKYGRKILNREKLIYLLLNKPKDFLTTTDDPEGRKTVMDLVANACDERIYPIGRLDRATTGLLLMTNDGELAEKLSHPSNEIRKIYQVELDKPITTEDFDKIVAGLELEDGFIKPDELSIITPDAEVLGIEIHSGKNRIVRRIFESLDYEVKKLDRTTYAGLTKKDLPRGNWRFLTEKEVIRLKYLI